MKTEYIDIVSVIGQRVRAYRNLDYKPDRVYSLQVYLRGIGWRVVGHTDNILLEDVAFIVGEPTRQRVIQKSRKLVHAYASGRVVPCMFADRLLRPKAASYDPYVHPNFYTLSDNLPVHQADYCRLSSLGMTIYC